MNDPLPFEDDTWLDVEIAGDAPSERLDKALARQVPANLALSRSRLLRLIGEGAVSRAGTAILDPKTRAVAGDIYRIRLDAPEPTETLAEDIALSIVYEDADLIIIDKAAGMVVHPAAGSPSGTLVNALLAHCGETLSGIGGEKRPGIVHRIDKDTTGLLVAAKSDRAHQGLSAQFAAHAVNRHYIAVVHGVPGVGDPRLRGLKGISFDGSGVLKIVTGLARHRTDRQRQAVVWDGQGRHAVTRVRVLEDFKGQAALVECWLETGRTHQIRVHMAYAGHGLLGDQTYGGKRKLSPTVLGTAATIGGDFPRQALHAASLGFVHPVSGQQMAFTSPLPADMAGLVAALRGSQ